jgi:hypothetical protein
MDLQIPSCRSAQSCFGKVHGDWVPWNICRFGMIGFLSNIFLMPSAVWTSRHAVVVPGAHLKW